MTKPLPIILVDMDGVFCDFLHGYYALAKMKFPKLYEALPDPTQLKEFYVEDSIDDKDIRHLAAQMVDDPQLFYMFPPIAGAIEGMKDLKVKANAAGLDVYICTAPHRPNKDSYKAKAEWVQSFLGFDWLDQLLIVRDKTVCNGLVLVDDKPAPLGAFTPTWKHVLYKQPYNTHIIDKHVIADWSPESVDALVSYALKVQAEH